MSAHLHRLELAEPGTLTGARVICDGGPEASCRQWCVPCGDGGYETCVGQPVFWPDDMPVPIAQAPVRGREDPHRWAPMDPPDCREATWLDACGLDELCEDEDLLRWDEDGDAQPALRSGPIVVTWDGDNYLWSYPEPAAPQSEPQP